MEYVEILYELLQNENFPYIALYLIRLKKIS